MTEQEKKADLEGRIQKADGELQGVLKKYDLELATQAFFTPDGRVQSRPFFIDAEIVRQAKAKQGVKQGAPAPQGGIEVAE